MKISQKDIKLLWGRSGNRCSVCKIELTQDKKSISASYTLGEQAHIVGEKERSARGKSNLTQAERNSYHNLILLCPNHHTEIDKNEADWPIDKLYLVKSQHELWVNETLSKTIDQFQQAKQVAFSNIIDLAVNCCRLEDWLNWTSFALSSSPRWPKALPDNVFEFRQKVIGAIWPEEYDEFKRATIIFSILLNRAAQKFMEHSELNGDTYYPHMFYKAYGWNDNYDDDVRKYSDWVVDSNEAVREATKAANWFSDVVRRDINPMFFAKTGKFLVIEGDISMFEAKLLELTCAEKVYLSQTLIESNI